MFKSFRRWQEQYLREHKFYRSVWTLLSGTGLAMTFSYLARPLLTRLYTPTEFGLLSFFSAVTTTLATLSSARYADALILPKRVREAVNLVALSGGLILLTTVLSGVIAWQRAPIAAWFDEPAAAPFLTLAPLGILMLSTMQLGNLWLTRRQRFQLISTGRITESIAKLSVQITAGFLAAGAGGLIGGVLVGWGAAALVMLVLPMWRERALFQHVQGRIMRWLMRRYRNFPRYTLPSALLNKVSMQLPIFGLLFFFAPEVAGLYSLSYGSLAVPIMLLGNSVGQVYYSEAPAARREGTLSELTLRISRQLSMIGFFPMLAILVVGPEVFSFVFGEVWRDAGRYAQYLSPWLFFVLVSSPLTRLFDVLERQRAELVLNVVLFVLRGTGLAIGGLMGRPLVAVALFGLFSAMTWAIATDWLLQRGGLSHSTMPRLVSRSALYSLLPLGGLLAVKYLTHHDVWVTISAVVSFAFYALIVLWRNQSFLSS